MLWERPITLRMMFLLENLARNIAIEHRRTEDSNGEYSQDQKVQPLDFSQEIRANSPSREVSKD
jgi:hypothetical protein